MTTRAIVISVALSLITSVAYGRTTASIDDTGASGALHVNSPASQADPLSTSVATGSGPVPLEQISNRSQARFALHLYERQLQTHLRNLRLGLPTDARLQHIRNRFDARLALRLYESELRQRLQSLRLGY